jgi:hypothetical protein
MTVRESRGSQAKVDAHRWKYARVERERRFLVAELPPEPPPVRVREIVDRYVPGTSLRLRRVTDQSGGGVSEVFKFTQKVVGEGADAGRLLITNTYLPPHEYELLASLPSEEVRKTRYSILAMGIDVFAPPLDGLILAEAEFDTDPEMAAFRPPAFVGAEVTGDPRFTGAELTRATRDQVVAWAADYGLSLPPPSS